MNCSSCAKEVLEIDVKCPHCGAALGATGAHRMLGQVMLGQYELVDVLGQGGMSVVFKGKHKMTDQEVALKILPPELAAHSQVKSRFLEEAKALAALDHPNIVHLYNFGEQNGFFVLAMQYVQGDTWERMILENKRQDWVAACRITIDVLRALEYAHGRGVIHRDMKPSNVLVRAHDQMATVMDFGIAKMTTSTKLTATGQTMGTVRYMSPEQVRGQEVDLRTDLYSLGATLYEALTGDTPFDGNTHFEIMTKHLSEVPKRPSSRGFEVPQIVEDALMRSLAKKPADRFENAREMRKVLEAALRDGDIALVSTQKVSVADLRPTKQESPPTPVDVATATAGGLASALEPTGASEVVPTIKRRSALPWIVLALVLAGGGVAAGVFIMKGKARQFTPKHTGIQGARPIAGGTFDGVLVETTGTLRPDEVARAYQSSVARLQEFAKGKGLGFPAPLQEILTIPQSVFCSPTAYIDGNAPKGCSELVAFPMFGSRGEHLLLLVDDRGQLAAAMDRGVAEAVCLFDPGGPASDLCRMTEQFLAKPSGG
ncbi:MAG TPA: serine/threonine-protein kinase [Kofleriaceae bacterium]|jgi:serine/threonine-protein kinase|nr:serine/threonine-protein kinase [Kofleriaceae bacterium]